LILLNPASVDLSALVLSESLYLVLLAACWLLIDRWDASPGRGTFWALWIVLSWASLTRPEGFCLLVSTGFVLAFRRGSRLLIAASAIPLAVWTIRNMGVAGHVSGYFDVFRANAPLYQDPGTWLFHITRIVYVAFYQALWGRPPAVGWPAIIAGGAIVLATFALILIGWRSLPTTHRTSGVKAAGLYSALHLTLHFFGPSLDSRFFVPILPVMLLAVALGAQSMSFPWRIPRQAPFVIALFLLSLGPIVTHAHRLKDASALPRETLDWIVTHSQPRDTILTDKTAFVYLYTQRPTLSASFWPDTDSMRSALQKSGVRLIALFYSPLTDPARGKIWRQTERWIRERPTVYEPAYDNPREQTRVFRMEGN
jgi:hypothetical protein